MLPLIAIKRIFVLLLLAFSFTVARSQPLFSMSTDVGVQRNFKEGQRYWAFGHTTFLRFHITKKDGIYVWFAYYSAGHYKNEVIASAKSPTTIPQQVPYTNTAKMRLRQFSVGWQRYLKGSPDAESGWNLYGFAGLGILMGMVQNEHSATIDTTTYNVPVRSGKANFKRLTVDLGAGWEFPLGSDFYLYNEAKVWIPTTDYPSKYLFINENAPITAMLSVGLRLLF